MKNIKLILFFFLATGIFTVSCTKDKNLPTPKKPVIKFRKGPDPVIPQNHIDTSMDKKVFVLQRNSIY